MPYYSYNSGTLQSVNTSAHNMVGFNAYNHSSGTARLIGGMEYQITGAYTAVSYIDIGGSSETISIGTGGYFTPTNTGTLTVTGGNSTTTCVHIVWDGEKDGDYEEYDARTYALDSSLELRGVPSLDGNNNLYYLGDTYESDGTVTRNAVKLALNGDETWYESTSDTTSTSRYFYTKIGAVGSVIDSIIICDKYTAYSGTVFGRTTDVGIAVFNSSARNSAVIMIRPSDNSVEVSTFRSSLQTSPINVVYLVTNPTTTSANTYANPQIVSDWGTEEYVDYAYSQGTRDVQIPVGHETTYSANLRAKLEMMPDSPSNGNGDYVVRQVDGINSYVPLIFPTELPPAPTEDGLYKLFCYVSDGIVEYAWSEF